MSTTIIEEVTDPFEIANKFNEYFANVGPLSLARKVQPSSIAFEDFLERTHY